MAYIAMTHWSAPRMTDDMIAAAQATFVPLILGAGASSVQMLRTGDGSFSVVTHYEDEATADGAQSRIATIRDKASRELGITMTGSDRGRVFAHG